MTMAVAMSTATPRDGSTKQKCCQQKHCQWQNHGRKQKHIKNAGLMLTA